MIPHPAMPAGWTTSTATVYPARYGPGVTRHRTVIGEVPVSDGLSAEIRVDREGEEPAVSLALVGGGTVEDVPALLRRLVGLGEHEDDDDDARPGGEHGDQEDEMSETTTTAGYLSVYPILTVDPAEDVMAERARAAADAARSVADDVEELRDNLRSLRCLLYGLTGGATFERETRPGRVQVELDAATWAEVQEHYSAP